MFGLRRLAVATSRKLVVSAPIVRAAGAGAAWVGRTATPSGRSPKNNVSRHPSSQRPALQRPAALRLASAPWGDAGNSGMWSGVRAVMSGGFNYLSL